ncbi:ankyrin repeat domain-containing protein SOWAHC-like isoform X3 [Arapaima gigas]
MGDVSEESVLRYLYTAGGKVSNSDVLKTFQHFVNHGDKNLRAKYREEFKVIIDRIAVTKSENGEKYVVLKKKYKQLMQEREAKRTDKQSNSPGHTASTPMQDPQNQDPALVVEFVPKSQYEVAWCGSPSIIITEAPESEAEVRVTSSRTLRCPTPQAEESQPLVHGDDEVDKDLGSKSEQELEDDSSGSVGSLTVTLEPLEKEWIHSAACGQLENLTQLLQQDASLASKKVTALHWAAKHGRGDMAALMADSGVDVNTKAGYTPLHIAALHGHHHIIDLLVRTYGSAKENVRDHSGHLAYQYLNTKDPVGEDNEAGLQGAQVGERKARRLVTLFQHKKKWGSAEDLVTTVEERPLASQLTLPPFRPRKFSR